MYLEGDSFNLLALLFFFSHIVILVFLTCGVSRGANYLKPFRIYQPNRWIVFVYTFLLLNRTYVAVIGPFFNPSHPPLRPK